MTNKMPKLPLKTADPLKYCAGHTLVDADGAYAGKVWRFNGAWHAAVTGGWQVERRSTPERAVADLNARYEREVAR